MGWTGSENLGEGLLAQKTFLETRVPSYARVLDVMLGDIDAVVKRVEAAWAERRFDAWYERPLLLLAALRFEALVEGAAHPLYAAIAREPPDAGAVTADAVAAALAPERRRLSALLAGRHVQTNETSRAVAWTWIAHLVERASPGRQIALVDLGCSAGLNLVADRLPSPWVDADGRPIPTAPHPEIAMRLGVDLRPIDSRDPEQATWLRACVWPGERERLERLEQALAALEAAHAEGEGPALEALSIDEAPDRLGRLDASMRVLAYQTIMRDYVPEPVKQRYFDGMARWLASRAPATALWVELENTEDVGDPDRMAALSVHLRGPDGVTTFELARTQPHPRRLFVDHEAVHGLTRALGSGGLPPSSRRVVDPRRAP